MHSRQKKQSSGRRFDPEDAIPLVVAAGEQTNHNTELGPKERGTSFGGWGFACFSL